MDRMPEPSSRPHRSTVPDHWHPEYWTQDEHNRFEDRVVGELRSLRAENKDDNEKLRNELSALTTRLAWLFGVLATALFLITFLAPYIRDVLNFPVP